MAEHDPSLDVVCPVCGAISKVKCASIKGNILSQTHVERRHLAEGKCHSEGLVGGTTQMYKSQRVPVLTKVGVLKLRS